MSPHPKIRLAAVSKPIDIEVQPGDGAAAPTAGRSGYEVVQRHKKKGMTSFVGVEPLQQDVPIFVDGLVDGRSVERIWEQIMALGGGTVFRAYGPVELPGHRHVFAADPEINEQVKDSEGRRIRFKMVLKLMEFVPADQVGEHQKRHTPKHQRGEPAKTGGTAFPGHSYTTTQGQTLIDVAKLLYGNWEMARAIGEKNDIADVHKKLAAGTKLKLPRS
jgi:hypothetical protein